MVIAGFLDQLKASKAAFNFNTHGCAQEINLQGSQSKPKSTINQFVLMFYSKIMLHLAIALLSRLWVNTRIFARVSWLMMV